MVLVPSRTFVIDSAISLSLRPMWISIDHVFFFSDERLKHEVHGTGYGRNGHRGRSASTGLELSQLPGRLSNYV